MKHLIYFGLFILFLHDTLAVPSPISFGNGLNETETWFNKKLNHTEAALKQTGKDVLAEKHVHAVLSAAQSIILAIQNGIATFVKVVWSLIPSSIQHFLTKAKTFVQGLLKGAFSDQINTVMQDLEHPEQLLKKIKFDITHPEQAFNSYKNYTDQQYAHCLKKGHPLLFCQGERYEMWVQMKPHVAKYGEPVPGSVNANGTLKSRGVIVDSFSGAADGLMNNTVFALTQLASHPYDTTMNLLTAVAHPIQTYKQIENQTAECKAEHPGAAYCRGVSVGMLFVGFMGPMDSGILALEMPGIWDGQLVGAAQISSTFPASGTNNK